MKIRLKIYIAVSFLLINTNGDVFGYCKKFNEYEKLNGKCKVIQTNVPQKRYILYNINPSEGFNLCRDVYVRVATFIKHLNKCKDYKWVLVLPPWGHLYHWQSNDIGIQDQITWRTFFNIESLNKFIPVLELHEFIKEYPTKSGQTTLDQIFILKNDEMMFKNGHFKEKNVVSDCVYISYSYNMDARKSLNRLFWGYINITSKNTKCITFHGTILNLYQNLHPEELRSVMFVNMEIPLHYSYGSVDYWKARRSMQYNLQLYEAANEFRLKYLNSNDLDDKTQKLNDWTLDVKNRSATGGPYLAVHFRRKDFLIGRTDISPSIEDTAAQIINTLDYLNLNIVFIATDAADYEYNLLKQKLIKYKVLRFKPTIHLKKKVKDGGIAIIDQIICSHARYFIGTHESTFSFRIQEDREILGFSTNSTFNSICRKEINCFSKSQWEIVWS